jgi:hypothetical protein
MKKLTTVLLLLLHTTICFVQNICVGEPEKITWQLFRGNNSYSFEEMYANVKYPNSPDEVKKLFNTKAPQNYDNYMSGRMQGFIRVPSTTTVTFNVTAEYQSRLYLSNGQNPANKVLIAYNNDYTGTTEHNKEANQTSTPITLTAGVYYYFDLHYVGAGWSDQANIYWKTDLISTTTWNIITAGYLYDLGCTTSCPPAGTPCNDNNANTSNDVQDGNCNCIGKTNTTNTCIGTRGLLESFVYLDIPGWGINLLTSSPKFPSMPSTSRILPTLNMPPMNRDSFGSFIQGYIQVPISGKYKFNLTGDDETRLYMSSSDTVANKNWKTLYVPGWTGIAEHNKYPQQTDSVNLVAGKYYYFEILSKEAGGGDHYGLYWQAPFTLANTWKQIPALYFYDYGCSTACIPANTPCDDGNIYTNNDKYNNQCNCVGTPCTGADCNSPLVNYIPYDKCNVTDQLDNNLANNWISCSTSTNPNPTRPSSHWLRYDLQKRHKMLTSQIWNLNVQGQTAEGFGMTAVDYSIDGTNWINLDTINLSQANGVSGYSGQQGPDIEGIYARYILFTSLNTSAECQGLAKVAFQAIVCPVAGTPCNDGIEMTLQDKYNNNCECKGKAIDDNPCIVQNLILGDSILSSNIFGAIDHVTSISTIQSPKTVGLVAGKSVQLLPGFESTPNAIFVASIDGCTVQNIDMRSEARIETKKKNKEKLRIEKLEVVALNNEGDQNIKFFVDEPGQVKFDILDLNNEVIQEFFVAEYDNKGYFEKQLRMKKISTDAFKVRYTNSQGISYEKEFVRN